MAQKKEPAGKKKSTRPGGSAQPRERAKQDPAQEPADPIDGEQTDDSVEPSAHQAEPQGNVPAAFPIVGIGASAGGLQAFEKFFSAMPPGQETGMAFVLVQHLSPDHKSILADLIKRYTSMRVLGVENGMVVQPNCTYIIPPSRNLTLAEGSLWLSEHETRGPHLTVDHFFRSLAEAQRERAICVIMSGTGSDGSLGLRAVKGEGGLVIAQSPDSCEYDGMPRSAIATGMVDYVLPPNEIPAQLLAYARHAFERRPPSVTTSARDSFLRKICVLLRAQTGHDFSQYKESTIIRRVDRRMALHQMANPDDYLRYARESAAEVEALFHDLLIGVTNFFRDPEAFKVLEQKVVPDLLAGKAAHDSVRVWVCGCSTGEEAYSLAIILYEHVTALKIQVFATDIDPRAIEQARAGVFPASIAADVSEERLNRFFTHDPQAGTYRIQKHIRDLLVFSEQDVTKDPPFSKLDLVSCRNLLIYLNADVQRKLIPLFHYALVPGGALFLGTSETVGDSSRLFTVVDRKWKLYQRLPDESGTARPALAEFVPLLSENAERRIAARSAAAEDEPGRLRHITEQAMLAHYGSAGVLVNGRGQILHIYGRTGKFLEPAAGDAAMNILPMARAGLRRELTMALHKAVTHKVSVSYPALNVRANGDFVRTNLTVRPVDLGDGEPSGYFVVLEEVPARDTERAATGAVAVDHNDRIAALEQELRSKDEYLQTTLEEMETANEELKSTNEELQSVNEELQSTNEELETSKEELQSVNEELSTVNAELQDKVAELSRANNDMNNLLAGTGVGTLFVDHQLRIARFTPAVTQVINLIESDIGRPLEHVVANLVGYDGMIDDIQAVLDTLVPKEAEVEVKGGSGYLMRIRPYRTMENTIEGAVVTLVDISERKKAEESLRRSEARLNAFINQAYAGVCDTDLEGNILFVNDHLCQMLGYRRDELLRRSIRDIVDPADLAQAQSQLEALARGGPDSQSDKAYVRQNGTRVRVHERVSAIRDTGGKPTSLLFITFDASERD